MKTNQKWPFPSSKQKKKTYAPPLIDQVLIAARHKLCLCLNAKEFKAALRRFGVPKCSRPAFHLDTPGGCAYEFETKKAGLCIIVTINDLDDYTKEHIYSVLVHEATHVWQYYRNFIGEQHPSPEFEAYSIQAISENLFYAYESQSKK